MSASNQLAAMLDELMGPKRNLELGTDYQVAFDDPNICKNFIVGFCPHDMFVNTKADLGACSLVHDERLRNEYPRSDKFEKLGFERDFLRFLMRLDEDNQKRIRKNQDKLNSTEELGKKRDEDLKIQLNKEIADIDEQIKKCMSDAEAAGQEGLVMKCQDLVTKAEELEKKRAEASRRLVNIEIPAEPATDPAQRMLEVRHEVCEVCGSMLIKGDAQIRVDEHLNGKMHVGFGKIRATIEELKAKMRKKEDEVAAERVRDREERDRKDRDRRDRDKRSRSRDRRRSRSGDRGSRREARRSRSRDRRDNRSGGGDRRNSDYRDRRDDRRDDRRHGRR